MPNYKPKKRRKFTVLVIILLALAGLGIAAFLKKQETVLIVQLEEVKRRNITEVVLADGRIQPVIQVKISPEVSGEIINLPVREGQKVKKGDLLVQIKPDFYQASVERAAASHQQSMAALNVSRAEQTKAELEFERFKKMFDGKIISLAQFEEATTSRDVAASRTAQAAHQVTMAKASLSSAQEDLSKTTIRSPLTGTVSQLNSESGERVLGTAQNMGTEIMVIADLNEMEARVEIGEGDIILIQPGQTTRLEVDSFRNREFTGIVTEIGNSALTHGAGSQQQATKFEVRIRINEKEEFRPGMSVSTDIETRHRTNVLAVPIQCVTRRVPITPAPSSPSATNSPSKEVATHSEPAIDAKAAGKQASEPIEVVFLARDGTAKMTPVTRGISDDNYVEITEGLEEGVSVITGNYRAIDRDLEDGIAIQVGSQPAATPKKEL